MLKFKLAIVSLCIAAVVPAALQAEKRQDAPAAPMPSQIVAAQKVFIVNAGGGIEDNMVSGGPNRIYNEFYADMKAWGHFQIVDSPREADLVLQVSLAPTIYGAAGHLSEVKLQLLDPKSSLLLWTFDEVISIHGIGTRGEIDKGVDQAIDKLIDDLKAATAPPAK